MVTQRRKSNRLTAVYLSLPPPVQPQQPQQAWVRWLVQRGDYRGTTPSLAARRARHVCCNRNTSEIWTSCYMKLRNTRIVSVLILYQYFLVTFIHWIIGGLFNVTFDFCSFKKNTLTDDKITYCNHISITEHIDSNECVHTKKKWPMIKKEYPIKILIKQNNS